MARALLQMDDWEWDMTVDRLQQTMLLTEDELIYLKRLVCIRTKHREPIPPKQQGYISPSVIIDNFLYHGDWNHAKNKKLLEELDIRHIINVCDYSLEQDILDQCHVLWINLDDDISTDISQHFETTNEFLQSCKAKGEKVLVHCQLGISRSSSIVLGYLMKYHHDSLDKAYDYLVERRRRAEPNLGFLLQLIRYEQKLRETKEIVPRQNVGENQNPIETLDEIKNSAASIGPTGVQARTKTAQTKRKRQK